MHNKTLSKDIDYLRTLAEAGEQAPLLSGRFYVLWGILVGFAYTAHYAIISGFIGALSWLAILWPGVLVIGLVGQALIIRGFGNDMPPGSGSVGNQASVYVWQFAGITMFALFAGLVLRVVIGGGDAQDFDWSIPVIFALYCVALGTTGSMAKHAVLKAASWIAALVVVGAIILIGQPEVYLLAALGVSLTALIPGLILLRAEPSRTV